MKVLLSWLRDFAPIEGDPVALGEQMSDLGMAVEQLDILGEGLDGVVVARVLATRPHPNADKIQLVDVDTGDGEALQIVCGAFNMAVGDLVPLATVGTIMPNGMEIGRRKLRGEWSNGMLCSARELGLGDRPRRHPHPAGRAARRYPVRRGDGHRVRRRSTTSRSTPTGPTPCRWPAWPATWRPGWACRSRCPSRRSTTCRPRSSAT